MVSTAIRELQSARASNPEALKIPEYGACDALRFVLASVVVLAHTGLIAWHYAADLSVQVFFALSGWLIGGILCRTKPPELTRFYYNRATRIWIPYLFCVFALYATSFFHEVPRSPRWAEFLTYDLTFTHNWFVLAPHAASALLQLPLRGTGNHFWSLAVEEQFYLIAPLAIVLLPVGRKIWLWVAISAIAWASNYWHVWYGSVSLGVLCAVAAHHYPGWHLAKKARLTVAVLTVVSAALFALPNSYPWTAPLFATGSVLLFSVPTQRLVVARWLGGVSFPLYLNAWIGIFVLHALEHRFPVSSQLQPIFEYLAAVGIAVACYVLIDSPVLANRNRFFSPLLGRITASIAYTLVLGGTLFGCYMLFRGT